MVLNKSRNCSLNSNVSISTVHSHVAYRTSKRKSVIKEYRDNSPSADEFIETESRSESSFHTPKSSSKVIKKTKPPKLKMFPNGEKSKPVIELFDWIIKPLPDLKSLCVEGQKKGMTDFWHSSAITEVKKRKFVQTASGTMYRLRGKLNKLCTLENGFSKSIANAFENGFPAEWKQIIDKFYYDLEKSITVYDECSIALSPGLKKIKPLKPNKPVAVKKKRKKNDFEDIDLDTILTPGGLVKRSSSADCFTMTRSGRLSLPPLARWQGQKYIFKSSSNTLHVGFDTCGAEKALLNETNGFMKAQRRFKKSMFHKSLLNSTLLSPDSESYTTSAKRPSPKASVSKKKSPVPGTGCAASTKTEECTNNSMKSGDKEKKTNLSKQVPIISLVDCMMEELPKVKSRREKSSDLISLSSSFTRKKSCHNEKQSTEPSPQLNATFDLSASPPDNSLNESMVLRSSKKIYNSIPEKSSTNKRPYRKRKRQSSISEDAGYCTEEQSCAKLNRETLKAGSKAQDRKRRKLSPQAGTELNSVWTGKEKKSFERALKTVDADSVDFWSQMTEIVGSRTEMECRQYHTIYLEEKNRKKTTNSKETTKKLTRKSSGRQKGEPVRGGKGTLKRKEDMRKFIKEQNEDYEDNLFDSTPFASRKAPVPMINPVDFDKDDSEIFGDNHNFFTPITGKPNARTPGTRMRAQLASTRKTPDAPVNVCASDTPVSITRQNADKYISTFMNHRKTNSSEKSKSDDGKHQAVVNSNLSGPGASNFPQKALFSPSIVVYDKESRKEDEDEEENNPYLYYWDEDEN